MNRHFQSVAFALALVLPLRAAPSPVTIKVVPDGFGASKSDIVAVCSSAGRQLLQHMDGLAPITVEVAKGQHGPISLFKRGDKGEYRVKLDTGKTYWSQYAYQFAHEICHVLCRYEDDYKGNLWFEETLCELASVYCLQSMSVEWRKNAPYPNWSGYAPSLRDYTDDIIRKRKDHLEILRTGLPGYYQKHAHHLRANPTDREKNGSMALALLPLFQRDPGHWNAIRWLNSSPSTKGETFSQYLTKWRDAAPARHREFIASVATLFGIKLPA